MCNRNENTGAKQRAFSAKPRDPEVTGLVSGTIPNKVPRTRKSSGGVLLLGFDRKAGAPSLAVERNGKWRAAG